MYRLDRIESSLISAVSSQPIHRGPKLVGLQSTELKGPRVALMDAKQCGAWLRPSDVDGVARFRATGRYSILQRAYVPVGQLIQRSTLV